MLNLYKCECCGKLFDGENAYSECNRHEQMHYQPANAYDIDEKPDDSRQIVIHSIAYDEKQLEPSSFIAYFKREGGEIPPSLPPLYGEGTRSPE